MFTKSKISQTIKDAFKVESLEQRMLLSADPILGSLQVALKENQSQDNLLDSFEQSYSLDYFRQQQALQVNDVTNTIISTAATSFFWGCDTS